MPIANAAGTLIVINPSNFVGTKALYDETTIHLIEFQKKKKLISKQVQCCHIESRWMCAVVRSVQAQ